MEALAIEAFGDYQGALDPKATLDRLFSYAMEAVMGPIGDPTGQSMQVDGELGLAGSLERKRAATYFGQMRRKVRSCGTKAEFDTLFCEGD